MSYPQPYGKYVLLERLGMGGMSEVDLARQRMGDRDFVRFLVIKRVKTDMSGDAGFIRMFKDEARITSELHHACIGQVYDFGRQADEYFLALEYVPGIDVRAIVNSLRDRGQRVPVRVALRIIADVLDALDYAHTKRDSRGQPMDIVHRDVNPRNIMVSVHGETKLIDFGVAKAAGRLERTKTDHVKGKFSYMAPEQVKGEPLDGRADIFAVGLTLHELLTGVGPFMGLNQVQIVHRLLHGRLPECPEVPDMPEPEMLRRLHDKALARDKNERYATAAAMRRDLERVAEAAGGLPTREQLAQFLTRVDPELNERIQKKIEAYSGELEVTTHAGQVSAPPLDGSSLSGTIDRNVNTDTTQTVTVLSTPAALALGLGVGGPLVAFLVVLLLVLMVGLGLWFTRDVPPEPTGTPTLEPVQPARRVEPEPTVAPAVEEPVEPEPQATPEPVVEPSPSPATRPAPRPVRPTPRPTPAPAEPVAVEPVAPEPAAPEPTEALPAPVVPTPAPAPAPEPAPPPTPKVSGTVLVNAQAGHGKKVSIDGEVVGRTPYTGSLPAGRHTIQVEGYGPQTVDVPPRQQIPVIFR